MTTPNSSAKVLSHTASPASGRAAYILKTGVLGWGVPVAVALTAVDWYRGTALSDLAAPLGIRLVLFALGGIGFGAAMWKMSQRIKAQAAAK